MPQRLFISDRECRVRLFPENGSSPADIDLSVLPVSPQLQAWFAGAVAGATGPGGPRRSLSSGLDTLSVLKRFTRFLAGLEQPPQSPDQLTAAHISGFILAGGAALRRDVAALRSILRFAADPPAGFAARLAQASVPRAGGWQSATARLSTSGSSPLPGLSCGRRPPGSHLAAPSWPPGALA